MAERERITDALQFLSSWLPDSFRLHHPFRAGFTEHVIRPVSRFLIILRFCT